MQQYFYGHEKQKFMWAFGMSSTALKRMVWICHCIWAVGHTWSMRKQNDSRKPVLAIHATITQIGQTKTVLATHATFTWAVDRYRQEYMFKNWPYTNTWAMNRTRDRGTEKKQLFKSHFTWAVGRYREKHIDVCHAAQQVMYVMPPNNSCMSCQRQFISTHTLFTVPFSFSYGRCSSCHPPLAESAATDETAMQARARTWCIWLLHWVNQSILTHSSCTRINPALASEVWIEVMSHVLPLGVMFLPSHVLL